MKYLVIGFFIVLFMIHKVQAVSLDGTTGTSIYEATSYSFADGDFARGFVRLNAGFSVPAAGTVSFNLLTPVAGVMNLNGTGTIALQGDLSLASNATLNASGGIIDGQNFVVFLQSNFSIPAGAVLEFASSTVIDGQGHTLTLESGNPGGLLLINGASGTTLTLRNLTLRGLKNFASGDRSISFAGGGTQNVVLENVTLVLDDDFTFVGGALDIDNFAQITGKHHFQYQSARHCTIRPQSLLTIDLGTTFDYIPFDRRNNHLQFTDATSRMFLNGAILFVPKNTGLSLTNGHLLVDNKAQLSSDNAAPGDQPIIIGNNFNITRDFAIDIYPAAQLELVNSFVQYQNKNG